MILVGKGRVCGGNLLCLCGNNLVALLAEFLSNGCYSGRISCYLNNAVLKAEIVAACFEDILHCLVLVDVAVLVVKNNNALQREQEVNAAGSAHVSAELVKVMADLACGTVSVIGKALNYNCNAVRTIALVYAVLVVVLLCAAVCLSSVH